MKHSITMPTCSWRTAIIVTGFIGWSGTFAVSEGGVRKIWVAYMGVKK